MDFDETLDDSYRFKGPLGAVAFVVIRGLEVGGVDEAEVERVLDALRKGLKGLDDEQCDTLVHVLERRLSDARTQGALYELVKLTSRMSTVEAHLLRDALSQHGIEARFNHEHLADPFPDHNADVELWVRRGDLKAALAFMDASDHESPEMVRCDGCDQENPAHFGLCWNCSTPLAEATIPAEPISSEPSDPPAQAD